MKHTGVYSFGHHAKEYKLMRRTSQRVINIRGLKGSKLGRTAKKAMKEKKEFGHEIGNLASSFI